MRKRKKGSKGDEGPTTPVATAEAEVREDLDSVLSELNLPEAAVAKIKGAAKTSGKRARRLGADAIFAKYAHAVPGTLQYDAVANKQRVEIECTIDGCDTRRTVFTSDLFQVRVCEDHKKAARKQRRKDKQAELKALAAKAKADEPAPAEQPAAQPEA